MTEEHGMFELLAPAGDLVKLRSALHFGADAVYFGGDFSLRAAARMSSTVAGDGWGGAFSPLPGWGYTSPCSCAPG